ncbi:SIS domain-containing protein [Porticoccaceae bacterium LTM1]|nr:SIS domain-containing protein [Porticoccaceae bacterium LTM1]
MKPATLTQAISASLDNMRKSERKVAEFVLANPVEVINLRIVDLARRAEVSEPTVVRFCRAVGCKGFQEFKLSLAQQLASSPSYGQIAVTETDTVREYTHKVFDSTVDTLLQVRDHINPEQLEVAIAALAQTRRVEFYGFGASASVAADAQHRFFRLQIPSAAYSDPHLQNMSATSLEPGSVVVAISQSGRTRALLDSMMLLRNRGIEVIGLAPTGTPVLEASSIPLPIDVVEDIQLYTPLSSRIAHLVVIDVLAIGVARHKGEQLQTHLQELQEGLKVLRMPE